MLTVVAISSCDKDSPNGNTPPPQPITENIWKLDNYNYSRSVSTQMPQTTTSGNPYNIVIVDSNSNTANNPYRNCQVAITFGTNDVGTYTVKSQNTTLSNVLVKNMHIKCTIASGTGTGAIYDSSDSNITVNVTKVDGKFVIDIPLGITLTRTLNDGMANPPTNFILTAQKIR